MSGLMKCCEFHLECMQWSMIIYLKCLNVYIHTYIMYDVCMNVYVCVCVFLSNEQSVLQKKDSVRKNCHFGISIYMLNVTFRLCF